jgi:hypothetical protein
MGGDQSRALARDGDLVGLILLINSQPKEYYTHWEKIETSIVASSWGHLHILDWLSSSGHILNEITYVSAMLSGRRDVVDYLKYKQVVWSENVSLLVSAYDPKYTKDWLRKSGINPNTLSYCDISFHQGELIVTDQMKKLFRELIDEGCPINVDKCLEACQDNEFRGCLLALKIEEIWRELQVEDSGDHNRVSDCRRYSSYLNWPPNEVMKDIYELL